MASNGPLTTILQPLKTLTQKGLKVSFLSTPKNIHRLPKIPPHLSSSLTFISLPLPEIPNLPSDAESASDVPFRAQPLLKRAFDLLEPYVTSFLESSRPDWILHDYASYWLPRRAAELGASRAFFSLFNAAWLSFVGPPSALIDGGRGRSLVEDFTVVPEWVPFESGLVYRVHEIARHVDREGDVEGLSLTPDTVRFGLAVVESEVVAVRSCREFEPKWLDLLGDIYQRRVFPAGFLPPVVEEEDVEGDGKWVGIKEWLDKWKGSSVIYVAMGSEASLTPGELSELAHGLERSQLPFFWVLRSSPELNRDVLELLPDGFLERVGDRGMVYVGWAPQVRILNHDSVGGFYCGWNSVIEGLAFGRVLVMFPMANDQGINARLLSEKGLGVEIPRNELDGSFTSDSVAESVRSAMVDKSSESFRVKAREMKGLFGDRNKNDSHLDEFISYLKESRKRS
ncbi:UDP-glycosyltransferase 91C1 [Morus notabilis]|uniref:UDP-glycosyltransferase 91C1 n=1 Tax=Morus notabilis TaxID=981085 RepID=W9RKT3_9ROSA|nr:UDP-glycosyltransferase 91C1 [Morus notabilis]